MSKKKPDIITEAVIIKSGVNRVKPYTPNEDGLVKITRKEEINDLMQKNTVKSLLEKEKEIEAIKKKLEELNMDKDDIKDLKKDIKKKKKKKDKKKKKKNKDTYMDSLIDSVPNDLAEYIKNGGEKGEKKKKKKDKKKKKKQKELQGLVIKEKKKNKDKENKDKDKFKSEVAERFKEVEKITRDNIREIDATMEVVDARIKEIMKSSDRVRGRDKALADYITAKTSLISSRQKAATDILSNRSKVYEIEIKKENQKSSNATSDAELISRIFPGIAMNSEVSKDVENYIGKSRKNKDSKKKKKKKNRDSFYGDNEAAFLAKEKDLLKSGDLEYSKYDSNIEYEGNFNVAIKKSFQTGDWKFVAVDDQNNFLDVPKSMLPSKKTASMKFDDEKDMALDTNTNRSYFVFNVPQI